MNPTRNHMQRFACFFLALFLILLLPASGAAQESTPVPPAESTEIPTEAPLITDTPAPTSEPIVEPTPELAEAPVVTTEPDVTVEPEATADFTAEPEVTVEPEATAEVTVEPEATADFTAEPEVTVEPEATAEVTVEPEATAEVTAEPEEPEVVELTEIGISKFPDGLLEILDLVLAEDYATAREVLLGSGYRIDQQNRVSLKIYPADGFATQNVEQRINRWDGRIVTVNPFYVIARIPLAKLPNLLESPAVRLVTRPAAARSTGPIGEVASEAFNIAGLQDWHAAGFTGTGVRIGLVDIGYALNEGAFTDPEYACLAETPIDTEGEEHGIYMIQAICDIAPNASLFTYEITTNPYQDLAQVIYEAIFDQIDVLVIAADISDLAPGDGTGLEDGTDDPYEALAVARAGGMVVFVAAGNYGQVFNGVDTDFNPNPADTRGDRYIVFETDEQDVGQEVARVYARYTPGDEIFISWNDWAPNGLGASDEDNLEDFTIEAYEYNTTDQSLIRPLQILGTKTVRDNLFADAPSFAFSIPSDKTNNEGCVVTNSGDGTFDDFCNVVIIIERLQGDSSVVFHMGLSPRNRFHSASSSTVGALRELQRADIEFVRFDPIGGGTALITTGGSISRPADSPDVIAVGAVCANETSNFALDPNSSRGTIYGENGIAPTLPLPSPLTELTVKPDIVSFSYISPRPQTSTPTTFPEPAPAENCDGTMGGIEAVDGFGGTSAAAAHAAAMTAVMLSNPSFRAAFSRDANGVQSMQDYIQRRTVELPLGNAADGYDYDYGAGLFILGSPDYNPANTVNPSSSADLLAAVGLPGQCDYDGIAGPDGNLYYVGQGNLNSNQDGSLLDPYLSISQAINATAANDCIVVMPGEYVTPILIDVDNRKLFGFNSVSSLSFPSTVIRVSGQYADTGGLVTNSDNLVINRSGGLYINEVDNTRIQGFTFVGARVLFTPVDLVFPDLPNALPRQGIFADDTIGTEIIDNNFGAVTVDGVTFDGFVANPIILNDGHSALVEQNTFQGNSGGTFAGDIMVSPVISVISHGTIASEAAILRLNHVNNNQSHVLASGVAYWSNLIYASDSYLDLVANTFLLNNASTLLYVRANADEDIRIVSNLFQRNTLSTTGPAANGLVGALVQTSSEFNDLSFINNTVVVNIVTDSSTNSAILGRGTRSGASAVGTFDFVNNVVFNNTFTGGQRIIFATLPVSATCTGLSGGVATRNNWWSGFSGTSNCSTDMTTILNGNRIAGSDSPAAQFMGFVTNPKKNSLSDPLYYVLGVSNAVIDDPEVYTAGVDASILDNVSDGDGVSPVTNELGNGINLQTYPFNIAANNQQRVWDIPTWDYVHGEVPPDHQTDPASTVPPQDVDLGAFEFINLNILNDQIDIIDIDEDTPVVAINFGPFLQGGYGNLTFSVTDGPEDYGTQCGYGSPNVDIPGTIFFGVQFGTGALAQTMFYCPAPDYYNLGLTSPYPSLVELTVRVSDEIGLNDSADITIRIDPVADTALSSVTTFTSDDFVVIANVGQQGVRVRARPFVNFGNFRFSERGNNDFLFGGNSYAVDYPFSYSIEAGPDDIDGDGIVDGGEAIFSGVPILDPIGSDNAVFVVFDLLDVEGTAEIQYKVTDINANELWVRMKVRSINRIPNTSGIYDDSSFAFDYSGTWTAISDVTAMNNTLHLSAESGAETGFGFRGTGFVLYMKGQGATSGGIFDLNIYINGGTIPSTLGIADPGATGGSAWTPVTGSTTIYQSNVWFDSNIGGSFYDTVFLCTTDAVRILPNPPQLASTPLDNYAITCNGFYYIDTSTAGYSGETLVTMPSTVHLVEVVNLSAKKIAVDAFSLLEDNDSTAAADVPLSPGYHEIDALELRDAFDIDNNGSTAPWVETLLSNYSNGRAFVLTGPATPSLTNIVSFDVSGGTGFALATTQETLALQALYTICVTDLGPVVPTNLMTCQSYDYNTPSTTALLYGVFRPFYGLDPNRTYRVDIIPESVPVGGKFVIDGVVVFDPSDAPVNQLVGSVDDSLVDSFVFGGGLEDTWLYSTGISGVFNSTLTTVSTTIRGGGPYVAFEVDDDVDTVYWTYSASRPTTAAMVCVDRAEGIATDNNDPDDLTDVNNAHGNCLVVNLLTGQARQIDVDGDPLGSEFSVLVTRNTIVLREDDFRDVWNDADLKHVFEIFSIYDAGIAVDRMVAIDSTGELTAGRYEEYTVNIGYYDETLDRLDFPIDLGEIGLSESSRATDYPATDFVQVFGTGAARDFGQGVMFSKLRDGVISFEFTGTGFAPAFRIGTTTEEVQVCWIESPSTVADALDDGTCQRFDNENRTTVYNALRPILGLTSDTYLVAIRFIGDNFSPIANRAVFPEMWFDGVVIYDEDFTNPPLVALSNNTLYQGNFSRHEEFNNFEYLGVGWIYDSSTRARTFSAANVDAISRGEVGATVSFITNNANAIILTRNIVATYSPLLVCATEIGDYTNRLCQTIDNTGRGNGTTITVYLTREMTGPSTYANFIVNITALNNGPVYFDAVMPVNTSDPLIAGHYDENNPNLVYNFGSSNLVLNGDFERIDTSYWTVVGTLQTNQRVTGTGNFYTGTAGWSIVGNAGEGIESLPFSLRENVTYSVTARVKVTSGTVEMSGPCSVASIPRTGFQTLRCEYTPSIDEDNVTLSFLASGSDANFIVDDVRVTEGAQWTIIEDRAAFGGYQRLSTTHGAEIRFGIEGTGFGLQLSSDSAAGRLMVCYKAYNPTTDDVATFSFDYSTDTCITFDNESSVTRIDTLRIIDGLAFGTYAVLVRDMEEGDSVVGTAQVIRSASNMVGKIKLDAVYVFDSTIPVITSSGAYNESAANINGDRFLQLLPSDRWSIFTNALGYSELSYASVMNSTGLASTTTSGGLAVFAVNSSSETRLVIDVKAALLTNSNQVLACVDNFDGIVTYNYGTKLFEIADDDADPDNECTIITTLRASRFAELNPTILPLLDNPGSHTIMVQPLSAGPFTLDDYQVILGTALPEGYYEETLVKNMASPVPIGWTPEYNVGYSGGSALVLSNTTGSMNFSFRGTGISIVTGLTTIGGSFDISITGTNDGITDVTGVNEGDTGLSTDFTSIVFGHSYSYTGLPLGTYDVTITGNAAAGTKVILDAVEVYGTLQTLGSLYDDNQVDTDGDLYLTYGPDNASWTLKTGTLAPTALNRTLHSTNRAGATLSFQMNDATGIVLYYGAGNVTTVQVCFREVATPADFNCSPVAITTAAGNVSIPIPGSLTGDDFFVSITNTVTNGSFQVDAVQVLETGLHEGIFDAGDINAQSVYTNGEANEFNPTTNTIELQTSEAVEFDISGVAFSLIIENAAGTSDDYTVCVEDAGVCDIINDPNLPLAGDTVPASGLVALSYAGLHDDDGSERNVTVRITNNATGLLRVKAIHILSGNPTFRIEDTSRYENSDARIRYLPFGSLVDTIITGNLQSAGSEHIGTQQGAMVYFEIRDLSGDSTTGFEIMRQEASTMSGAVEICYGQIGDTVNVPTSQSLTDVRLTQCDDVSNVNSIAAFQVAEAIATSGDCEFGCWVTIRNRQALAMAFDFVRLFDTDAALSQGFYEDNYPGLNRDVPAGDPGSVWNVAPVAQTGASGGFVHQAIVSDPDTPITNENGAFMWFLMDGTGFSISFVNDTFSDAVRICYRAGDHSADITGEVLAADAGSTCQVYDNEARLVKTNARRSIFGLPDDEYTVAVQMLRDNFSPVGHAITALPLRMSIDAVEIYDESWADLEELTAGNRYETDFASHTVDNQFVYIGRSWITLEASRARSNSGLNVDQVNEYGAGIAFRTGADSLTLYTNLGRSNTTFRICATPTMNTYADLNGEAICQDFSTLGTGLQMPLSFRFFEFGETPSDEYLVTIVSLDDQLGFIDAIELSEISGETLTAGFYEGTNVNIFTDTGYEEFIVNGRMEVDGYWDKVGDPISANQSSVRYEGSFAWHIVAENVGDGIESQAFSLSEIGVTYTALARVKVTSGSARLRLVQGNSQVNIIEFRPVSPTGSPNNGDWITLRAEFQLTGPYTDLHIQVVANSTNSIFDVDDVHLYRGGLWTGVYNRSYSAGSAWRSQTAGASLLFSFTGTGFELGTEFGAMGGEMEICYYDTTIFGADFSDNCFTYQNETVRTTAGVSRSITGLPDSTYNVRIRDDEDGSTSFRPRLNASRSNRTPIGTVAIDYLRIFGENTITTTDPSFFNENATNSADEAYLQLYPSADWGRVTARAGTGFSANTYSAVVTSLGRVATTEVGQSAVLYVDVPNEGATVVLYTGPISRYASTQFLVCAGNEMNGRIAQRETLVGTAYKLSFFMSAPTSPSDCVIRDGTQGTALAVGPNDLAALGVQSVDPVRVSFTTLMPGQFIVDGFQVIYGNTLTAGVYDTFLPDNLLNFNSSNDDEANRAASGCNPDFLWCTVKISRSFGDTVLSTQDVNASLRFDIRGTGFSVLANLGVGARMRICYTQIPVTGDVSFPTKGQTGGSTATNFTWDNSSQDLSLGGVWCEQVTTNNSATAWNAVTPDRRVPAKAPQYGFSYYGLPMGNYAVQVLMLDNVPSSSNFLQLDAIVVFGDYTTLDVIEPGFYDDTEAPLSYEPFTAWNNLIARSGPPKGPYNLTEATTVNAGALVQMQVDGNALTLFQTLGTRGSSDIRICMVVTGAVIHCTTESATSAQDVQNPSGLAPYALAFELANFSQAGKTTYFAPIMFYGLGSSSLSQPHSIIIENRDHTKIFSIDAILIQE